MERIPGDQWDEQGCFVYRALTEVTVSTWKKIDEERKDGYSFADGQLVSVDFVHPSRFPDSRNGPFLRLTDGKGWLYEKKYGRRVMERLPVEKGLWCFYVDNCNVGIALRLHPFDKSPHVLPQVVYSPMQKIYCDRKVEDTRNGMHFYRVQGTSGWVFDTRLTKEEKVPMMLPESMVQTGLFAYQLIYQIGVRLQPTHSKDERFNSGRAVLRNEIVCCDIIRETPSSAKEKNTGPFLRLADNTGWIFGKKEGFGVLVKPYPIQSGRWRFRAIDNVAARGQPMKRWAQQKTCAMGSIIDCDKKIVTTSGTTYFGEVGLNAAWFSEESLESWAIGRGMATNIPWEVEDVRELAMRFRLSEITHNEVSRVVSFRTFQGERINVYYTTRTIGSAIYSKTSESKMQIFQRDCDWKALEEIFRNPKSIQKRGYTQRPTETTSCQEDDYRRALLECDEEFEKLWNKRMSILESLQRYDIERAEKAMLSKKTIGAHEKNRAAEGQRKAQEDEEARRRKQALTCGECSRQFVNEHALMQHCRDAHGLQCEFCYKVFKSEYALDKHRDDTGHW